MNGNRQLLTPRAKNIEAVNRYSQPSITKNNRWSILTAFSLGHISIKEKVTISSKVLGFVDLNVYFKFPILSLLVGNSEANFVLGNFTHTHTHSFESP